MLRRLIRDDGGAAAVEFVLVLPVLILLYFGVFEVTQLFLAEKRVAHVAAAVGDLVAQSGSLTSADLEDVYDIGQDLIRPLPQDDLAIRVTKLQIDANGAVQVRWTSGRNLAALPAFSAAQATGELCAVQANQPSACPPQQVILVAETGYTYDSALNYALKDGVWLHHMLRFSPRENNVFLDGA
jgi:Flp pilus assembly protein TadG